MQVVLQTLPWYWRVVHRIQGAVNTQPEQYLATGAIGLAFLITTWIVYLGGRPLKRRFSTEGVEIARSLTVMVVALAYAALVVVVWEAVGDVQFALLRFAETLTPGTNTAVNIFVAFITLLATYTLTRVTKRVIRHWSTTGRISAHQRELAHHAVQLTLFFIAIIFIFILFQRNPRDLFLGAGALGIVIGFAARKTLSDVLAGLVILIGRPFEAGDWIAVGEREGIVTEITIFNTQVRTFNEEHVLIPNDSVTNRELINYSKTNRLRLITEVGVDYDADVATAASIATEAMKTCDAVVDTPKPDVVLESFADSAVVLQLRYWIDSPTIQRKLSAQNEVINAVKNAFESEGIKIPYPQRELMGREEADGLQITSDGEMSVEGEVERAVRRVGAEAADIEEPVEERYGGDSATEAEAKEEAKAESDDEDESEDEGEDEDSRPDGGETADKDATDDSGSESDGSSSNTDDI
ncbi:MAG: small conductance mechanosensitive channel, partial [Natronomonas sp.]